MTGPESEPRVLVLDAMGVLYEAADDVAELLIPFVVEHGGGPTAAEVKRQYLAASLGHITAHEFWGRLSVDPSLEDDYLARHRVRDETLQFLDAAADRFSHMCCLSNDVAEWSAKLRRRFGLERWIKHWFISGELGVRKPAAEIYAETLRRTGLEPGSILFVDDRIENLDAAKALGWRTAWYTPRLSAGSPAHPTISDLRAVLGTG